MAEIEITKASEVKVQEIEWSIDLHLTSLPASVILTAQQFDWKLLFYFCRNYYRLSRKRLDIIYRLFAVPQGEFALGVKVNDRPIRYFFGEACHDFNLRERAKGRNTTQRRAGLPVRNRVGKNGKTQWKTQVRTFR